MIYESFISCKRQLAGNVCHFRHLDRDHPDVIANLYFNNLLTEDQIQEYQLRPCDDKGILYTSNFDYMEHNHRLL